MAPQSRIAVEAISNLATVEQLLLTGTLKQEQIYKQIIYFPLSDIIHAPYVNRILLLMVIWNAIPEIH